MEQQQKDLESMKIDYIQLIANCDRVLRNHANTIADIKTLRQDLGQTTQNFRIELDQIQKDLKAIKEKLGIKDEPTSGEQIASK